MHGGGLGRKETTANCRHWRNVLRIRKGFDMMIREIVVEVRKVKEFSANTGVESRVTQVKVILLLQMI